ncbi:MAG TPA: DUF2917 domain-containing protein [Burkholderiales bacterium]
MKLCIQARSLLLDRGQSVAVPAARGTRLEVVRGRVWLTQEGDREDYFVAPGETFDIARNGTTVLHALELTEVRFDERAARRSLVARGWSVLSALAHHLAALDMHRALRGVYRF